MFCLKRKKMHHELQLHYYVLTSSVPKHIRKCKAILRYNISIFILSDIIIIHKSRPTPYTVFPGGRDSCEG